MIFGYEELLIFFFWGGGGIIAKLDNFLGHLFTFLGLLLKVKVQNGNIFGGC